MEIKPARFQLVELKKDDKGFELKEHTSFISESPSSLLIEVTNMRFFNGFVENPNEFYREFPVFKAAFVNGNWTVYKYFVCLPLIQV